MKRKKGVQQRIKENNPLAELVPCNDHSLNLLRVHTASVSISAVTFLDKFNQRYLFCCINSKRSFSIYIHYISKGRNSSKNCSIGQIFFYRFNTFQVSFFLFFESYRVLKTLRRKYKKTELLDGHLGF